MTNTRTWGNKPRSGQWAQTTWLWCGGVQPSSPNTGCLRHGVCQTILYCIFCLVSTQTRWAAALWISGSVWNTHTCTHMHTHSHNLALSSVIAPSLVVVHKRSPTRCLHWTKQSWAEPNWSMWLNVVGMTTLTAEEKRGQTEIQLTTRETVWSWQKKIGASYMRSSDGVP